MRKDCRFLEQRQLHPCVDMGGCHVLGLFRESVENTLPVVDIHVLKGLEDVSSVTAILNLRGKGHFEK